MSVTSCSNLTYDHTHISQDPLRPTTQVAQCEATCRAAVSGLQGAVALLVSVVKTHRHVLLGRTEYGGTGH